MQVLQELFDRTLHNMGLGGLSPYFVVIGAMDGVSFDEFHGFIRQYRWSGLMVEPIPEQFERLRDNFARLGCSPDNRYENCAIAEHDGHLQMLRINQGAIDRGEVHPCFGGMSAIHPPRNGLASEGDAAVVQRFGELIEVPCLRLTSLLEKHQVERIDILHMDAEGWDFRILSQLDFARWRPTLIRCEYINLVAEESSALLRLLAEQGYVYRINGQNLDAVTAEHWRSIEDADVQLPAAATLAQDEEALCLTSALATWSEPVAGLPAGVDPEALKRRLLQGLSEQQRVVLYVSPGDPARVAAERNPLTTHIVLRPDIQAASKPLFDRLAALLAQSTGADGAQALRAWGSLVAPFLLNDATLYHPFGSNFYLWVDADLLSADGQVDWRSLRRPLMQDARLRVVVEPASPLLLERMQALAAHWHADADDVQDVVVDARCFGGTVDVINAFNGAYYGCLDRLLGAGFVPNRSEIFSLLLRSHRYLFALSRGWPGSESR